MSGPDVQNGEEPDPISGSPHGRWSPTALDELKLPKNRSTGNLLLQATPASDRVRMRVSFDAESDMGYSAASRFAFLTEHEHTFAASGVRPIRQHPPSHTPSSPSTAFASFGLARSSTMASSLPSSRVSSYSKTGPTSPVLSFGADLSRFPPESLPSCTMGAQMGEPINSRQNVLRQSIELMRDRPGLTGSDPGIASGKGQSKREVEAQSVMELLSKATLIGQGSKDIRGLGLASGPLTEPATLDSGNVFEQSLLPRSQTPDQLDGAGDKSHTNGVEETEGASEVGPKDGVRGLQKKTINDFVILEDIGQGAYGQVKLARSKKSSMKKMVLKYVTKRRILVDTWTRDRRLGTVPLEIHVLDYLRHDGLKHPNIVEMSDFFEDDINYYIEMVPHGLPGMDLFDYIELRVSMQEEECRSIFRQVARAVHHLHIKALVVHRDIKDENVILDSQGNIKLIDFGSATYIKNGPFDVFVGTIDYAAPEVLAGRSYRGKEQDVWALGILLYTIVYKENPFYSVDEIMDHDLRVPHVMSENCIDLIRQMLNREVGQRINISQVLEHPWCREEDEEENNYDNDNDGDGTL